MVHAYAESTHETYRSRLLVFHVFCDSKAIPEEQRAPASNLLIKMFISCMIGNYSRKTVSNYINGVHAWHILHGADWLLNDAEVDTMLKAAISLTPINAKCSKHEPYTTDLIVAIQEKLNLDNPLDASVFACLTTTFYATARVGEFTIPHLNAFDPALHISLNCVKDMQACQIQKEAFPNHLQVNEPPTNFALFAYWHKDNTHRPLMKMKFLSRLASAMKVAGHKPLQGHRIHIGSTLEYLLWNIPFDVVKVKGWWASDVFLVYLQKHAQIMAPYMQAVPTLHNEFL
ncbi:hypothetical protein BDR05DRAFT_974305 [Suillus weaverae]|nr:hypothetical protein BDR05DRAFT_974305 [Suillus weaverae]